MGLFGGSSRHTSRRTHPEPSSRSRRREYEHGDEKEPEVIRKPGLEELRRHRAVYYSVPAAERKKIAPSTSELPTRPKPVSSRSRSDRSRKQPSSHKRSSRASDAGASESIDRTEEYVYGSSVPRRENATLKNPSSDTDRRKRTKEGSSRPKNSRHRQSLPTVLEAEVTPSDSISQVGTIISGTSERTSHTRPSLRRSRTTSSRLSSVAEAREDAASSVAPQRSAKRPATSSASSIRRHSTTSIPVQARLVECLTCGSDDVPVAKSAKLACTHRMCHDCLKRIFEMSVNDPQHMPPKCCTDQHIPLKHVDKLFDLKFKVHWNRKYQEYHTKNRIYCPSQKCGEWIKPSHVYTSRGRSYAMCPRCKTKACLLCNNTLHKSDDCPDDPEIAKLVAQAKEKGWQRCYRCNAMVEKKEGCNHMTCRCSAEFCILCGVIWKACDCPLFSYQQVADADRPNHMRVPEPVRGGNGLGLGGGWAGGWVGGWADGLVQAVAGDGLQPAAPVRNNNEPLGQGLDRVVPRPAARARNDDPLAPNPRRGPPPEVTYQQEVDARREQERSDAELARRLQLASIFEPADLENLPNPPQVIVPDHWGAFGVGNATENFMNADFVHNAANVIMDAFGDAEGFGRRGERSSGRRRRAVRAERNAEERPDAGLPPNFLGDESVLGVR